MARSNRNVGLPSADLLGTTPDAMELARLVKNYPTYEWEHRRALLQGYFQSESLQQLVERKLIAKEIDINSCTGQSLGGHARWVTEKVKKTFARILYLRYRIDKGFTRRESNQRVLQIFSSDSADDAGQSAVRKMTAGAKVDE